VAIDRASSRRPLVSVLRSLRPLRPLLAIIGIGLKLRHQKFGDIIITLITIAIAVLYWLANLHSNTRPAQSSELVW